MFGYINNKELKFLFKNSDLFILPSVRRSEGFGYVLLEAMQHGCALISTELGTGTSYVNKHGYTGIVVNPKDSFLLKNAIKTVLENDLLLETFQKNSLERVKKFTLISMIKSINLIYKKLYD